jgi:hypothetical protein
MIHIEEIFSSRAVYENRLHQNYITPFFYRLAADRSPIHRSQPTLTAIGGELKLSAIK